MLDHRNITPHTGHVPYYPFTLSRRDPTAQRVNQSAAPRQINKRSLTSNDIPTLGTPFDDYASQEAERWQRARERERVFTLTVSLGQQCVHGRKSEGERRGREKRLARSLALSCTTNGARWMMVSREMDSPFATVDGTGRQVRAWRRVDGDAQSHSGSRAMSEHSRTNPRRRGYAARVIGVDCRKARRWYQRLRGDCMTSSPANRRQAGAAHARRPSLPGLLRYIAIDCSTSRPCDRGAVCSRRRETVFEGTRESLGCSKRRTRWGDLQFWGIF